MRINYEGLIQHLRRNPKPFGLLTMQATSTTGRLMKAVPEQLTSLFSAEHGFFGHVPPGERADSLWHPYWNRPVHSLYGEHRKPTPEMLSDIRRMVIDLCDIGVRCYTYLATLKNTLEACAEANIEVVILDRPLPLGGILDGPMRKPEFESFVAPLNVPFCHGMTPGECALWIVEQEHLRLKLDIIPVLEWNHDAIGPWPNFIPPSPAIRSWDSAALYPMTVFTEAYPSVDCDRQGPLAFRVIGAPWMRQKKLIDRLEPGLRSCGVAMRPYRYQPSEGKYKGQQLDGILFSVEGLETFYPVTAGILVITTLLQEYGDKVFLGGRDEWFDKLFGSSDIRETLAAGRSMTSIFQAWMDGQDLYQATRVNLYQGVLL